MSRPLMTCINQFKKVVLHRKNLINTQNHSQNTSEFLSEGAPVKHSPTESVALIVARLVSQLTFGESICICLYVYSFTVTTKGFQLNFNLASTNPVSRRKPCCVTPSFLLITHFNHLGNEDINCRCFTSETFCHSNLIQDSWSDSPVAGFAC